MKRSQTKYVIINNDIAALRNHNLPDHLAGKKVEVFHYSPPNPKRLFDVYHVELDAHIFSIPGYIPGKGSVGLITVKIG